MNVIGLNTGANATACLIQDGKITHCIQEERITRIKNFDGLPVESIRWILDDSGLTARDIDKVVVLGDTSTLYTAIREVHPLDAGLPESAIKGIDASGVKVEKRAAGGTRPVSGTASLLRRVMHGMELRFPAVSKPLFAFWKWWSHREFEAVFGRIMKRLEQQFEFKPEQFDRADHHLCHALAAVYTVPHEEKVLVFSLDGEGDNLCASVGVLHQGQYKKIADTSSEHSLGWLYFKITEHLGMKGKQDEFKVMGMAPYAKPRSVQKTYDVLKELIWVEGLQFNTKYRIQIIDSWLKENLYKHRFDNISAAIQRLTEELVIQWIKNAIETTGIRHVALTGGVFMNIKANKCIAELDEVEQVYAFPSCGDESCAIGAAYFAMMKTGEKAVPLEHLYLGPEYGDEAIEAYLQDHNIADEFTIEKCDNIEERAAELLADGHVVARCSGPLEWGARALGNRSILANPSNFDTLRQINDQIKNRDFWMPFTPSILEERADDYFYNPKKICAYYMAISFDSTPLARKELVAALHPYDFTIRPQLVRPDWNASYYKLIKEFEKRTGIGAVLNTSFNLHREPNVMQPRDALHTLRLSGLQYLIMGSYLVSKPVSKSSETRAHHAVKRSEGATQSPHKTESPVQS